MIDTLVLPRDTGARRSRDRADVAHACAFATASDPIDPFGTRFDAPTRPLAQRLAVLVCAERAPQPSPAVCSAQRRRRQSRLPRKGGAVCAHATDPRRSRSRCRRLCRRCWFTPSALVTTVRTATLRAPCSRGFELAVAPRAPCEGCDDLPTLSAGELDRPAPEPATTAVAGNLGSALLADRRVLS